MENPRKNHLPSKGRGQMLGELRIRCFIIRFNLLTYLFAQVWGERPRCWDVFLDAALGGLPRECDRGCGPHLGKRPQHQRGGSGRDDSPGHRLQGRILRDSPQTSGLWGPHQPPGQIWGHQPHTRGQGGTSRNHRGSHQKTRRCRCQVSNGYIQKVGLYRYGNCVELLLLF